MKSTVGKYEFPEVEKFKGPIESIRGTVDTLQIKTNVHTNLIATDTNLGVQMLSDDVNQSRQENRAFQDHALQGIKVVQDFVHQASGKLDIISDQTRAFFAVLSQGILLSYRICSLGNH